MKIIVAGKDKTESWGPTVRSFGEQCAQSRLPMILQPEHTALGLKEAANEEEHLEGLIKLVKMRYGLETDTFPMVKKPGLFGSLALWFKKKMWSALNYQHKHMADQQSLLNELVIHTLECETRSLRKKVEALERRVEELDS